jgi:hypothetical protein
MYWLSVMILAVPVIALVQRFAAWFRRLRIGYTPVVTLVISAVLWWLAITVMVSAAALRWQVVHDRVAARSRRHTVTARHRLR